MLLWASQLRRWRPGFVIARVEDCVGTNDYFHFSEMLSHNYGFSLIFVWIMFVLILLLSLMSIIIIVIAKVEDCVGTNYHDDVLSACITEMIISINIGYSIIIIIIQNVLNFYIFFIHFFP